MKRNTQYTYKKSALIAAFGLRRVTRTSDGMRVWLDLQGKEYATLAEAVKAHESKKAPESAAQE